MAAELADSADALGQTPAAAALRDHLVAAAPPDVAAFLGGAGAWLRGVAGGDPEAALRLDATLARAASCGDGDVRRAAFRPRSHHLPTLPTAASMRRAGFPGGT